MARHCNRTITEKEERELVKRLYQNRLDILKECLKVCNLTIVDLCVHLGIDSSTYYRYANGSHSMSTPLYIHARVFFEQYMMEHKITPSPQLCKLIEQTNRFTLDPTTNEKEFNP